MAVLALAKDDRDMRARLGRMIVARSTKSGRHGSPALLCPDLLIAVPLWTKPSEEPICTGTALPTPALGCDGRSGDVVLTRASPPVPCPAVHGPRNDPRTADTLVPA